VRIHAIALLLCGFLSSVVTAEDALTNRWSIEKANQWYQQQRIGAINWGFVAGKSQTNYP